MTEDKIVPDMEVIGADGVHVGTVEAVVDGRIRLSPETRIPFDEVRRAHEQLVGGDNVGKIVLVH